MYLLTEPLFPHAEDEIEDISGRDDGALICCSEFVLKRT